MHSTVQYRTVQYNKGRWALTVRLLAERPITCPILPLSCVQFSVPIATVSTKRPHVPLWKCADDLEEESNRKRDHIFSSEGVETSEGVRLLFDPHHSHNF